MHGIREQPNMAEDIVHTLFDSKDSTSTGMVNELHAVRNWDECSEIVTKLEKHTAIWRLFQSNYEAFVNIR